MKHVLILICFVGLATPLWAYHDGGVAHCNGCHTMHSSPANPSDTGTDFLGNQYLLKESNSTDTCLGCHGITRSPRYGNTWGAGDPVAPGAMYPGGNFQHIIEDNLNDGHGGSTNPILGEYGGHSIISDDMGSVQDTHNAFAPGAGAVPYNSANMHCTSCHDPHGREHGNFRLLYGNKYPKSYAMGYVWNYTNAAPIAEGTSVNGGGEAEGKHTAYQSGMGDWCANCHEQIHTGAVWDDDYLHPTDAQLGAIADNYNRYNGTGNHEPGPLGDAYVPAIPVEFAGNTTDFDGPVGDTSKVMCLTCHRAHASSAPYAGRWDFNITIYADEGVESGSYKIPNPYAATAGDEQRSLCNKCHMQDPELP